ncbi:MAG: VWA domain-containing protein [Gammaproteobacteria bacterium]|nr:VWA domain-containing protein [Gammaproteobacteria bacterium]
MLLELFYRLRKSAIPVSLGEYLSMLEGLEAHVAGLSTEQFYYFSRLCLVKDERFYDRYDEIFGDFISGRETLFDSVVGDIPAEWLRTNAPLELSEEERKQIDAMGGWDELMETLRKRLEEQKERHEGGNKWIGTGGRSPFGADGYNPEGVRIGQKQGRQGRAVKVWDKREYRNLDNTRELGTRNLKMALRKLRTFAREGLQDQLDLEDTINSTAKNAGWLDLKMVAEKRNAIKVLLFIDIGGSMDWHARISEELFAAASSEFKRLEYFYFHNFIYEKVWKDNQRRHTETIPTLDILRSYGPDYKVIFVGDATMSPYEIAVAGGSVEHWNEEAGAVWMQRLLARFPYFAWLNPEKPDYWDRTPSIRLTRELIGERMFSLSVDGIDQAIASLKRSGPLNH